MAERRGRNETDTLLRGGGLRDPLGEPGRAEVDRAIRDQGALLQLRAEIARLGSATTARVALGRQPIPMNSSNRYSSGPPTSMTPSAGGLWLISQTAAATSSAAMGRISTCGSRTMSPSVAPSAILFTNSKNCVAWTIVNGIVNSAISLLGDLCPEVATFDEAVGPDNRESDVVADAGVVLGREQVAGGGREELHHRLVLERGRVRDVDDHLGPVDHLREALAGERVDAGGRRRGYGFVVLLAEAATTFEPIRPVPPITTNFMFSFRWGLQ